MNDSPPPRLHTIAGRAAPRFSSILFDEPVAPETIDRLPSPDCFADLHLDRIVAAIVAGRAEYHLEPFFHAPLRRVESIRYRHGVLRDLERPAVAACVQAFAQRMRAMRACLARAEKLHYRPQQQRWFLDAVERYCYAVEMLARDLPRAGPGSEGLLGFRHWLDEYAASPEFTLLASEARGLHLHLSAVRYRLLIDGPCIWVSRYDSEPDYAADVLETFARFAHGSGKEYRFSFPDLPAMNHVEAAILDRVALLYPDVFGRLEEFCNRNRDFLDRTLAEFDRQVQFYLACLEYAARLRAAGLPVCYPEVSDHDKEVRGRDVFDAALAERLVHDRAPVVLNDFELRGPERVLVVSGANQGGKTTFARAFGQLHYLAALGCPVPAREARLFLFDRLFTHFEREEDPTRLTGKLEDDLVRIQAILRQATSQSVLVMNESLSSATFQDALALARDIMGEIVRRDLLCVYVTFLVELASLGESTVSLVADIDPEDPARRSFRIVRRPADGLAYAAAIARKYRLTYEQVRARMPS